MKLQSESYSGPVTLRQYERFQNVRDTLAKEGIKLLGRAETDIPTTTPPPGRRVPLSAPRVWPEYNL
jgi:hypothetical protein